MGQGTRVAAATAFRPLLPAFEPGDQHVLRNVLGEVAIAQQGMGEAVYGAGIGEQVFGAGIHGQAEMSLGSVS